MDAFPFYKSIEDDSFFSGHGVDATPMAIALDLDRIATEVTVETINGDDDSPHPSLEGMDADPE